ncbi:TPA: hypothetical protein I7721_19930 [Vibrio vulnificus]|nr:hypothetical protein [Vibrio vulnificus]
MLKYSAIFLSLFVLSGCGEKQINCNDDKLVSSLKTDFRDISIKASGYEQSLVSDKAIYEVSGVAAGGVNSDHMQRCEYTFSAYPYTPYPMKYFNKDPIVVFISENNNGVISYDKSKLKKDIIENKNNFNEHGEHDGFKGTDAQLEYKKSHEEEKKLKEKAEEEKIKEEKERIEVARVKRDQTIRYIKNLNDNDYKLTTQNDVIIFYVSKSGRDFTDDELLSMFSPAYKKETDIFKKEDLKKTEVARIKTLLNEFKNKKELLIKAPITTERFKQSDNYLGISKQELDSLIAKNSNISKELIDGFDPVNNTIDLSKGYYGQFCFKESDKDGDQTSVDGAYYSVYAPKLNFQKQNKLSSCVIELNSRDDAVEAYEILKRYSSTKSNTEQVAGMIYIYLDGDILNDGLNAYITKLNVYIKNDDGNERVYLTSSK